MPRGQTTKSIRKRKIQVSCQLTIENVEFIEAIKDPNNPKKASRAAIIGTLLDWARENPAVFQ